VTERARRLPDQIPDALGGPGPMPGVAHSSGGSLPSVSGVSGPAEASVGSAGSSLARLVAPGSAPRRSVPPGARERRHPRDRTVDGSGRGWCASGV